MSATDQVIKIIGEEAIRNKALIRKEERYAEVVSIHDKLKSLLDECNADHTISVEMDEVFQTGVVIKIHASHFDVAPVAYTEYIKALNLGNSICQQPLTNGMQETKIAIHDVYKEIK